MDKKEAAKGSGSLEQQQSLAEMLGALVRSSATVVRAEIELVIQRFRERVRALKRSMLLLCAGVLFSFAGLLCLGGAAIIGLSSYMSSFSAALLVGAVFASTGVVIVIIGYRQLQKYARSTAESVKEGNTPRTRIRTQSHLWGDTSAK